MQTNTIEAQETKQMYHEIIDITPDMAAEYLSRNIKNRKLNLRVVSEYAIQMQAGQWQLTPQGISFNEYNELQDGQHRCAAVIESGTTVKMYVFFNVPADTFKVLDTGYKRNTNQIFQMEGIKYSMEKAAGIRRFILMQDSNSNELQNLTSKQNTSSTQVLNYYRENKQIIDNLCEITIAYYNTFSLFPKSNILAVIMYLNLHKKHTLSTICGFFDQLFIGRSINSNSIADFRAKLIKCGLMKHLKLTEKSKIIMLKKVWNAYINGKELKAINDELQKNEQLDFI